MNEKLGVSSQKLGQALLNAAGWLLTGGSR
jgi:hypothetical protein